MRKIFLISLILFALFAGCKKYPDGPLISFRSAEKRLYGSYHLTQYDVNGVDSLNLYYDSLPYRSMFFYDYMKYSNVFTVDGYTTNNKTCDLFWEWSLTNKNKTLKVNETSGTTIGTGPFGINKTPEWTILKLTNKETKMKTTFNGKEYSITLKKL